MEEHELGPNGALLYCMEALEVNFDWLKERLESFDSDSFFVFDFPGQVELFTNHQSVYNLLKKLEKEMNFRLVAIHLADSSSCKDKSRFISLTMLTLQSMMRLECPQINVMSKFDKFNSIDDEFNELPLSFYADCHNLSQILDIPSQSSKPTKTSKLESLTRAISELIDDFGLVSFIPLAVEDKECMAFLMQEIDKANGSVFGGLTTGNESIFQAAMTVNNREEYLESMERKYM
jgi:GPN-loop GTPase